LRARRAGFDIIYIYAAHDLSLAMHFLQKRRNQRSDEYGGSRIFKVVAANAAQPTRQIVDAVLADIDKWTGVVAAAHIERI